MALETRLKPTWDWILNVMDATEAQLRFGASLTNSTDASHPLHPLHLNPTQPQAAPTNSSSLGGLNVLGGSSQPRTRLIDPNTNASHSTNSTRIVGFSSNPESQRNFDRDNYAQSSRREFLTYALSLMRSHSSEHRDSLPVLDITALRHIAYVLDGMVFYMRSAKESENDKSDSNYWADADENENDDTEDELQMSCDNDSMDDDVVSMINGSRHTFFQRSESTLCLGCPPPDPFNTPMSEALPLADQPHLLQPNACREDLFGIPKQPITIPSNNVDPPGLNSPLELPPTRLGLSSSPRNAANAATLANLASQYESHYSYAETSNEPAPEEQAMAIEVDEQTPAKEEAGGKQDSTNKSSGQTVTKTSSVPAPTQNEPLPGGSKDGSSWRQPEGFNIYMQLKKKTYFDFHDEETKSNNDNDKRAEGATQDLSCLKSNTDSNSAKMELDSDHDELTDSESDGRSMPASDSHTDDNQSGSGSTVRPQIIVTPRKIAAAIDSAKADILARGNKTAALTESTPTDASLHLLPSPFNVFATGHSDAAGASTSSNSGSNEGANLSVIAQGSSNSGSPSKSVIVRAGPSVSFSN